LKNQKLNLYYWLGFYILNNKIKMTKKCKLFLSGIIVGELIVLFTKDEKFRENFTNAKGIEKCKVVFNNLVDLNKSLIVSILNKGNKEFLTAKLTEKLNDLQSQLLKVKEQLSNSLDKENLKELVNALQEKIQKITSQLKEIKKS